MNSELFKQAAGVDIVHVPYKGIAPAVADLGEGRVEVGLAGYSNFRPLLAANKVRLLAVLEPKRYARLPDLPALREILPQFRKAPSWIGILGPARLPKPVLERLYAATMSALKSPEAQKYFDENSNLVIGNAPDEFASQMRTGHGRDRAARQGDRRAAGVGIQRVRAGSAPARKCRFASSVRPSRSNSMASAT